MILHFMIYLNNMFFVCLCSLKSLGIDDLVHFDFLSPPSPHVLAAALETLYSLGAVTDEGTLTDMGRRMSELPLVPQMARCLLASLTGKSLVSVSVHSTTDFGMRSVCSYHACFYYISNVLISCIFDPNNKHASSQRAVPRKC